MTRLALVLALALGAQGCAGSSQHARQGAGVLAGVASVLLVTSAVLYVADQHDGAEGRHDPYYRHREW